MALKKLIFYLGCVLLFTGCKTYQIPVDLLRKQLCHYTESDKREVTTVGPMFERYVYRSYPIDSIDCLDKNDAPYKLPNGPAVEMRVTRKNNHRVVMYFDTIDVTDSTFTAGMSRFIPSLTKTISFSDISKIEVQNGGKKFYYAKK